MLLGGLNELTYVKRLDLCLAHCEHAINVRSLLLGDSDGIGQGALGATVIAKAKVHIVVIISEKYEGAGWYGSHESFVPGPGHLRAERMQVAQHGVVMIRFTYFMVQLFIP